MAVRVSASSPAFVLMAMVGTVIAKGDPFDEVKCWEDELSRVAGAIR